MMRYIILEPIGVEEIGIVDSIVFTEAEKLSALGTVPARRVSGGVMRINVMLRGLVVEVTDNRETHIHTATVDPKAVVVEIIAANASKKPSNVDDIGLAVTESGSEEANTARLAGAGDSGDFGFELGMPVLFDDLPSGRDFSFRIFGHWILLVDVMSLYESLDASPFGRFDGEDARAFVGFAVAPIGNALILSEALSAKGVRYCVNFVSR